MVTTYALSKAKIMTIIKYPRTRHIEGSRLQAGDASDDVRLCEIKDKPLIIEEKVDGANVAVSFTKSGELRLQSRGHFLSGGGRERQFSLFKSWAMAHQAVLSERLGSRFIMYGEWLFAKHTVFYDRLPHYFMEFDIYDREAGLFLSTKARRARLLGTPIMPVPVVHEGPVADMDKVLRLVKPSLYKSSDWRQSFDQAVIVSGSRPDMAERQTEDSDMAEGLYIKSEEGGIVTGRYKYVRADFVQAIVASDSHWHDRPIIQNQLADGVEIFAPRLGMKGAYDA